MHPEDLAYIAGFFDGEGSITIHENGRQSPRGVSPNHTLSVSIGNTNPDVLHWIQEKYGGIVCRRKRVIKNHRSVFQWVLRCKKAANFLQEIEPYLRMKKRQCKLAIEFQAGKIMQGPTRVTQDELARRESIRTKIRAINAEDTYRPLFVKTT